MVGEPSSIKKVLEEAKEIEESNEIEKKLKPVFAENQKLYETLNTVQTQSSQSLLDKFETLLIHLDESQQAEGEELLYPALFDKQYSVLDYINSNTTVFYFDYDRLLNSKESLDREYMGLYKKSRFDELVLSPEKILFDFEKGKIK